MAFNMGILIVGLYLFASESLHLLLTPDQLLVELIVLGIIVFGTVFN